MYCMVVTLHVTLVNTNNAVHNQWKCYINVACNMDVLRVLLIYLHSPSGTVRRWESCIYVTGYWKTDHVRTFGQLLFIGPANSHTHTLPVHCCINGLSWLVCFSRHGFADHVKSRLRQWDPWRALDGRYGSDIHPCIGETSLKALQLCLGLWLALLGHIATPNGPIGGLTHLRLPTRPLHLPHPLPPTPLYMQSVILQQLWKKVAQNPAVLASYYR